MSNDVDLVGDERSLIIRDMDRPPHETSTTFTAIGATDTHIFGYDPDGVPMLKTLGDPPSAAVECVLYDGDWWIERYGRSVVWCRDGVEMRPDCG